MVPGFIYTVEHRRNGRVLWEEVCHNLIPDQGVAHVLGVVLLGQAQITAWRLGLFEGNYTPNVGDTMASFPGSAVECVSYTQATRPLWVPGAIASNQLDNSASVAHFNMNNTTPKTVYGHFLSSSDVKSGVAGTLLSIVRYTTPRVVESGDDFTVIGRVRLVSN